MANDVITIPPRLPTQDSSTGRAVKAFVFSFLGFAIGLGATVWAVPGVPEAVKTYVESNIFQVLLTAGIPAGLLGLFYNMIFRKDVPNY